MDFFKKPLFVAIALNLLCLLANAFFVSDSYSSLDDLFMSSVLTGAYGGELDVHLYFVNVIYAYALIPFYKICSTVGWYGIFELLAVFISFTSISYVVLRKLGGKIGGCFVALLLCCLSTEFYLHVAFTQCAAALTASGILLLCFGYAEKTKRYLALGVLLMVWGYVMRKEMFLLGLPTLCASLFFVLWRTKKIYLSAVVAIAICFFVVVGLKQFDRSHYLNEGYDRYAAYQWPRAFFGDGDFYDGEALSDELDERGMSSYDYQMLKAWYFNDKEVFSVDSLYAIMKIANRNRYDSNYVFAPIAIVQALSTKLLSPGFWCWAMLCFALIFFSNKRSGLLPWTAILILGLSYEYLILQHRIVGHVEAGIWLYANVLLIPFLDKDEILSKKQWLSYLQIAGLVSAVGLYFTGIGVVYNINSRLTSVQKTDWELFMEHAENKQEDVFLLPYSKYKELASEVGHPFYAVPAGSWQNIYSSGYWNFNLPTIEHEQEKRGVTNMLKDIKNENVYVIADEFISLVPFYEHHYHEKLVADTVKTFGHLVLLKYRGGDNENDAN